MSLQVCKFYSSNRNCKFGKNCRFLHSQRPPPLQDSIDNSNGEAVGNRQPYSANPLDAHFETTLQDNKHEVQLNPASPDLHSSDCNLSEQLNENEGITHQKSSVTAPRKICHHFVKHGKCAFGRNCRFAHNVSDSSSQKQKGTQYVREIPPRFQNKSSRSEDLETEQDLNYIESCVEDDSSVRNTDDVVIARRGAYNGSKGKASFGRICRYFRSGYCSRGKNCMFSHSFPNVKQNQNDHHSLLPENEEEQSDVLQQSKPEQKPRAYVRPFIQPRPRAVRPPSIQQVLKLSELELDGTDKYRQFDISYLQKRFLDWRTAKDLAVNVTDDFTIDLMFSPSDPDWPFDVKSYELQLTLPKEYPKEKMVVKVPADKQDLPESVRRYLEVSIAEWLSDREASLIKNDKVELMARPFFKWLDRKFEDLMTEALKQFKRELTAKAAGMEFISANQLKAKYSTVSQSVAEAESCESEESEDDDSSDECLESDDENDNSGSGEEEKPSLSLDADRKGTEIKLRNLQLKQNASSILFEKLRLIVQCMRCKNHSEITIARGKVMVVGCDKCSHEMLVQYRPTLAHQFSSVAGYLDLDNCVAFDLIFQDCTVIISCLACSKMTKINGLMSGQMVDGWCQACNARFKFAIESVKFYHLEPSGVELGNKGQIEVVRAKSKKTPKDPAIREGYPLPEFGTCKHYKQSYRWLRFPCCGKAYPCDVCHDRKEDHEMEVANRMICGHCCKEQNYSGSRPCNSCSQHLVKVHSSHWEGGTGCRDKIAMSRNDQQKYKSMNKTLSNHKKKVTSGSQKKNTKLRHV